MDFNFSPTMIQIYFGTMGEIISECKYKKFVFKHTDVMIVIFFFGNCRMYWVL